MGYDIIPVLCPVVVLYFEGTCDYRYLEHLLAARDLSPATVLGNLAHVHHQNLYIDEHILNHTS